MQKQETIVDQLAADIAARVDSAITVRVQKREQKLLR